jgi:hypothetical protein
MSFLIPLLTTVLRQFHCPHGDENLAPREGWAVLKTDKDFQTLVKDTRTAVKAQSLIVVTQAGPTAAAKKRGITILGNRVIDVFNNDLAGNVLETSTAALIEAPHSPLRHRKFGRPGNTFLQNPYNSLRRLYHWGRRTSCCNPC